MKAFTTPLWIDGLGEDAPARPLKALPLRRTPAGEAGAGDPAGSATYDEAWLQRLIHHHPELLPIAAIEPSFSKVTSICTELPAGMGFIDNLMMTPEGGIVIVEVKLWRNPEARRAVFGQILEYAKDLARLDYEGLQDAVRRRLSTRASLFELAHPRGEAEEEAGFVDAVTRNLRLGRFLALICGDGMLEGTEALGGFVQRHLGLRFTLGLVEMSLWTAPDGEGVLVQPRILARTLQIERAVVRVEDGVALRPSDLEPSSSARPSTITEASFLEAMGTLDPRLPDRIGAFLKRLEEIDVHAEVLRNMSLKWTAPDGRAFHLGSIGLNGKVGTDFAQWSPSEIGRLDIGTAYQVALAAILPGGTVKHTRKETGWRVVVDGADPSIGLLLDRQDGWIAVIEAFIGAVKAALAERLASGA